MIGRFYIFTLCIAALCSWNNRAAAQGNIQAGNYLAGQFAQTHHDWKKASQFIHGLTKTNNAPDEIAQRAMILSIGSGDTQNAITLAKQIKNKNPDHPNIMADIILITNAFKKNDYKTTAKLLKKLPEDGTVKFVRPFIDGWLNAAQNKLNIQNLTNNTAQLYHAILISDFLNDHTQIEKMIDRALQVEDINNREIERIADIYGHVGLKDKARDLYKTALKNDSQNKIIKNKISDLEQGKNKPIFKKVTTAQHGMAKAFHDIASILYNEKSSESARVFANIALYLDPEMNQAKLLLAEINKDHKQYKEAISIYKTIEKPKEDYLEAQHKIADIYETTEDFDKALTLLKQISKNHQNIETFIKIGNLHREKDNFTSALHAYNKAIEKLGGTITQDYWHIHYMRGIAYEQAGDWDNAEKELKAALTFQPDHPYVLNYLGYAWADKGINLQDSLTMIKRAVDLRPSDGYITDSLGWAMYRIQDYKNAVPVLERAVELLPYDPTINDHLGDAYWKVGRKLEAEFQWKRAKNHAEDEEQAQKIEEKLASGIKE